MRSPWPCTWHSHGAVHQGAVDRCWAVVQAERSLCQLQQGIRDRIVTPYRTYIENTGADQAGVLPSVPGMGGVSC